MWVLATVSKGNNRRIRSFRYVDDCQSESRTILESLDVSTSLGFFGIASYDFISLPGSKKIFNFADTVIHLELSI